MLRELVTLFRQAESESLTREAILAHLDISPDLLDQLLHTLVQRGHLVEVGANCHGCNACPLEKFCAGIPSIGQKEVVLTRMSSQHLV